MSPKGKVYEIHAPGLHGISVGNNFIYKGEPCVVKQVIDRYTIIVAPKLETVE